MEVAHNPSGTLWKQEPHSPWPQETDTQDILSFWPLLSSASWSSTGLNPQRTDWICGFPSCYWLKIKRCPIRKINVSLLNCMRRVPCSYLQDVDYTKVNPTHFFLWPSLSSQAWHSWFERIHQLGSPTDTFLGLKFILKIHLELKNAWQVTELYWVMASWSVQLISRNLSSELFRKKKKKDQFRSSNWTILESNNSVSIVIKLFTTGLKISSLVVNSMVTFCFLVQCHNLKINQI